jgi:hypothetical protein
MGQNGQMGAEEVMTPGWEEIDHLLHVLSLSRELRATWDCSYCLI